MKEFKDIEAIQFIQEYCDFSNPNWVWILTGISRNKDKENPNEPIGDKYLERFVLTKSEDILESYQRIKERCIVPNTTYRIYVSLNARDVVKTTFTFQRTLLDIGYGLARNLDDALNMSKRLGSLWKTELAQTTNRGTKRVLFDVDTNDVIKINKVISFVESLIEQKKTLCRAIRPTVSGYHFVIDACDTRAFEEYCKLREIPIDIQRDSMVFVESWRLI